MDKTFIGYQFSQQHTRISCEYANLTESIQVIRISNIDGWHFERTVFAGQRLFFETVPEAVLEVSTGEMITAIVCDRIPCLRLRAAEPIQRSVSSTEDSSENRYASSSRK
ncbi:MAG: hypothetical protein DCF25_19625 [Leptolyngbya foveolarum]|uniref:DUF1830 domain-containing protein n=1 Tax=Leptolyngbya foveolarum TaxID=47253 RepID=A0A2W4TX18_9CYAN|nr:MAG: hypothetical protein DCF25_19625 [Leptolyngbya foveolarum]